MSEHTKEFLAALNGGRGDLDAWLERNNETKCRAVIQPIVQQRDALLSVLKELVAAGDSCADPASLSGGDVEAMLRFADADAEARAAIAAAESREVTR